MINIENLLDACGISYTEKQLSKLDKLVNELLKKVSLHKFDSNETTQHDSIPDSEDRLRNEDFASETELKPFQHYIQEFDFESEPHYNHIIKEEILEESSIEIKEELPNDPFANLATFNSSEGISDNVHENQNLNLDNRESRKNILITTFECYICEKKFSRKDELKRHTDSVHKKKKPHQCPICYKTFSQKCEIKQHTDSVHEKKKPHKCSICDKTFARKYELKSHTEIVHEKKKPYMCSFCDFKCSKKGNLKQHMWIKHDEVHN